MSKLKAKDSLYDCFWDYTFTNTYANGLKMIGSTAGPRGVKFEGSDGWVGCTDGWRTPLTASNPAILDSVIGASGVQVYRPSEVVRRTDWYRGGEHRNFIDCVKSRQPCYAPAETGHRSITIAHIGNIAMQFGRRLRWNPEAERFVNDREADAMLRRTQREPWTIANIATMASAATSGGLASCAIIRPSTTWNASMIDSTGQVRRMARPAAAKKRRRTVFDVRRLMRQPLEQPRSSSDRAATPQSAVYPPRSCGGTPPLLHAGARARIAVDRVADDLADLGVR